jgi:phosphocarrier protein HPr
LIVVARGRAIVSDGTDAQLKRTLQIVNPRGLHARASRKLAELALKYDARIVVRREEGGEADATSLMDLMMLGAGVGSEIEVEACGVQAADAIAAIAHLVEDGFGERD